MTSLVIRDGRSSAIHGFVVPHKGVSDERVAKKITRWIVALGYKRAVIRLDQEPSIVALRAEIRKLSATELVPEYSPVKDSKSNGMAENAVKELAGMVRTLKDHVEAKTNMQLKGDQPILAWIIDYAGILITRMKVGTDGKTAYQRLKWKKATNQVTAICEKVLYMPNKKSGSRLNKLEPKFKYGILLGVSPATSESLVGTADGVYRARVVRRLEEAARWDVEFMQKIRGTPWDPSMGEKVDVAIEENPAAPQEIPEVPPVEVQVRRMKVTKEDIRRFGYTPGCPGCTAIAGRKSAQGHNDLCRSRIEGKLEQEEEGRARVEKRRLIIDEAVVDYHEKQMKIAHDKQEGEMKDDSSAPIDIPVERRQYNSSEQPSASKRDSA